MTTKQLGVCIHCNSITPPTIREAVFPSVLCVAAVGLM